VEGNTTFYATPSAKMLQEWVDSTPQSFRFCPKLPRTVSHAGKRVPHFPDAEGFIATMRLLGERLGPMFLQLPPRYPPSWIDDLREFLNAWSPDLQLAVEVRHLDWFSPPHADDLEALLRDKGMARVVIDTRPIRNLQGDKILDGTTYRRLLEARQQKPDLSVNANPTANFAFLRYIGHPQLEQNDPYLSEWADRLADWLRQGVTPYVFCHCPDERFDPWICRKLSQLVSDRYPLPPLPWDSMDSGAARQERLF
jgi:uncharacterized protein YecE (DUF72 family)